MKHITILILRATLKVASMFQAFYRFDRFAKHCVSLGGQLKVIHKIFRQKNYDLIQIQIKPTCKCLMTNFNNVYFFTFQAACAAAKRLEEISLGKSLLTSIKYIEILIDSERKSDRPNKQNRLL